MSPAMQAHLRLLASLPVRTHIHDETSVTTSTGGFAFPPSQIPAIKKRMKQMRKAGMTLREISAEFGVATATVGRYVR